LGQLPRVVMPNRYRITLTVDPRKDGFSGHTEIDVVFKEKRRAIFLHGRDLNVLAAAVRLNARHTVPAHYMQVDKSGVARLIFVDEIPAGKATLVFDYEAPFGKSLSGLYKVVDRGDAYAFTQFESISAREAFPSFDEPGFKTPFQLGVSAPGADRVVSNTPVQSVSRGRDGMTSTLFQWTRPLPTYLIALAVGPLDIVDAGDIPANQVRNKPLHLRGVTARGNGSRIRYALSLTPKIVAALENYFGLPYPFQKLDVLAVPDFAAGAMENAGAITFRERLLLLDADAPIDQKRSTVTVQAHELTHQWFGDFVTPGWWDDIWLNESFASWMEYKIAQSVMPSEQFETETLRNSFDAMDLDELASARQVHQPVRDAGDIEDAFDSITYDKGSSVLSMFEGFLGEDLFRKGIHSYLTRYSWRNATAENFVGTIADTAATQPRAKPENVAIAIAPTGNISWNGHAVPTMAALIDQLSHMSAATSPQQLRGAFASFIDQPGTPRLRVRLQCNGAATATVSQNAYAALGERPVQRQWHVPACFGVAANDKYCRIIDRRSEEVLLGASCPSTLIPNDEGRGYFLFTVDDTDRASLVQAIGALGPSQQITILHNLAAALHAGEANASDLLHAVKSVAPDARWDVLDVIDDVLRKLRVQSGFSGADLLAYRKLIVQTFGPRLTKLGYSTRPGEAPATALARERLATLLVSEGRDPVTTDALARMARSLIDGKGNTLPPELTGEALRAGISVDGAPFANKLIAAFLASDREYFRRQIVYAFAGSEDQAIIRTFLGIALTPRMRTGELRYLFEYMGEEPPAWAALWSWYKSNYTAMLKRVSRDGMVRAVGTLRSACDETARDDVDAFFAPKTTELTGTQRPLALVEEKIARCAAFRQAKSVEVATALRELSK
jgi:alanyl aminopeptidase